MDATNITVNTTVATLFAQVFIVKMLLFYGIFRFQNYL